MTRLEVAEQIIKQQFPNDWKAWRNLTSAIEAALKARDERAVKICNDYEHRCAETCAQTQDAPEGTSESRTYWRADGASDALEIVATAIMADDEEK